MRIRRWRRPRPRRPRKSRVYRRLTRPRMPSSTYRPPFARRFGRSNSRPFTQSPRELSALLRSVIQQVYSHLKSLPQLSFQLGFRYMGFRWSLNRRGVENQGAEPCTIFLSGFGKELATGQPCQGSQRDACTRSCSHSLHILPRRRREGSSRV
jgi:hypothetical protein